VLVADRGDALVADRGGGAGGGRARGSAVLAHRARRGGDPVPALAVAVADLVGFAPKPRWRSDF
jgi:hypothetical protein